MNIISINWPQSFSIFACLVIKPEIALSVCSLSVPLDEDGILSKREKRRSNVIKDIGLGSAKDSPKLKLAYLFENQ